MSYVTVEEADQYIAEHMLPAEAPRIYWNSLDTASKQILLNKSFAKIERLPYNSSKCAVDQATQFPRGRDTTVPQEVKDAQVVEALASSDAFPGASAQRSLRMRGVRAYSIGHLSETLVGVDKPGNPMNEVSPETLAILSRFLSGGYSIC